MRKFSIVALITFIVLFLAIPTFAACNYLNFCAPSPYKNEQKNFWAGFSTPNSMIENLAQGVIKSELKKYTGQDFEPILKIYDLSSLIGGKFKSLSIRGKNVEIQGFHFSDLRIQTLCDYNYIDLNSRPISLKENAVLGFWAEISAQDLINTIEYKNYSDEFSKINLKEAGIARFHVYSKTINIENGKLYFMINAKPLGQYKPMDISIGADLLVKNGQILNSRFNYINLYNGFDLTNLSNIMRDLNNLNFAFDLYGNSKYSGQRKAEVQIMNLEIINNKIYANGIFFLPKKSA